MKISRKGLLTGGAVALSSATLVGLGIWANSAAAQTSVERGYYLVNVVAGCGDCHTPVGPDHQPLPGMLLAGGQEFNELPAFDVFSPNLTPDPDTGIGNWTEDDIVRAIREGHTPEDETLGPPMPVMVFNNLSDEDAHAIAAYLKSIPAVHNVVPEPVYNIPLPDYPPAAGTPAPSPDNLVAYGRYLVTAVAGCLDCHTQQNPDGTPNMAMLGAGGMPFAELPNGVVRSANITGDADTGIGNWTDEEIATALTTGRTPDGALLYPAMPYNNLQNLTQVDLDAIIAFIRTLPPVANQVDHVDWQAAMGPPPAN